MEKIIVTLSLAAAVCCIEYNGLRARYGLTSELVDVEYFFNISRTISEVESTNWVLTERPAGPLPDLVMYCSPERIVCSLYESAGFVAGIMIAIPVEEYKFPLVKPEKNFVKWSPPVADGETAKDYWTTTEFFTSEESLQAGTGPKLGGPTLQEGAVWVQGHNGSFLRIPTAEAELNTTVYKRQNCITGMGTHYHYNMTPSLECEETQPWFAVTTEGALVATGFQWYGSLSTETLQQWFENISDPRLIVGITIPLAPTCLAELAEEYGVISLHIFYINEPWNTVCTAADSAVPSAFELLLQTNTTSS